MAGFSLLALLDDISSVLDDVTTMAKVAAQKTAGVLGDDLALTAKQVFGVRAQRELPVVMSVAKGSLINKLFLIPLALLLSVFWPWLITPLLMIGGAYLCAEGGEKIWGRLIHKKKHSEPPQAPTSTSAPPEPINNDLANQPKPEIALADDPALLALMALEKKKIAGAIRTDIVLSTEIIVIALGSIPMDVSLGLRTALLMAVGFLMTIVVYGSVALIVKLDDIGYFLTQKFPTIKLIRRLGDGLILAAPILMKILAFGGTIAMFMVGGGILIHGIPVLAHSAESWPIWEPLMNAIWGFAAGTLLWPLVLAWEWIWAKRGKK
ncbi:MAG: DUF808 domain-containing protein [Deltaproteobacteria bacterium]|jgi:predicted DNA repair protein MutK|nr:DUF808 domain-containing protein [Deltaproteobacteria bacterium]